jgi:hypothetical protein
MSITHIRVHASTILSSNVPRLNSNVCSPAGPPPAPSLVCHWAFSASYSALLPETPLVETPLIAEAQAPSYIWIIQVCRGRMSCLPRVRLQQQDAAALCGAVRPLPAAAVGVDHQTDPSHTLISNTPPEWEVWCTTYSLTGFFQAKKVYNSLANLFLRIYSLHKVNPI